MIRRVAYLLLVPCALAGQGWRATVDVGVRTVAFRGVQRDSISRADLAPGASPVTPDGYAAFCLTGTDRCTFYRPGPETRSTPASLRLTGDVWGLGVRGLRLHANVRWIDDLAGADAWPLATPHLWLTEGYAELARSRWTVRVGRLALTSRLGWQGLDGAHARVRVAAGQVDVGAWGGWGLAEGAALPVTSAALNPLDEYQPRDRQLVAGADVGWRLSRLRGRVIYQREVDPAVDYFISERTAGDVELALGTWGHLRAGAEYDLAAGEWGSGDIAMAARGPFGLRVSVGGRRYRPYFPLWTIWGAFSPSSYRAVFATAEAPIEAGLTAWGRGEWYVFEASDARTALVTVEDRGWRVSGGARWVPVPALTLEGTSHGAFGPGAASLGFEGSLTARPRPALGATFRFGRLVRPLELRYDDVDLWQVGGDVRWQASRRTTLTGGLTWVDEARERPDAGAFRWNQVRVIVGLRVQLGSAPGDLPAAVRAMPEAP